MKAIPFYLYLFVAGILFTNQPSNARNPGKQLLSVYLDGNDFSESFIHRSIDYVNFVRDPKMADAHVFVTRQKTGGRGYKYIMNFIGINQYSDLHYNLSTISLSNETDILKWEKLLKTLQIGLLPYVSRTEEIENIKITQDKKRIYETEIIDPWKFWVFNLKLGSDFEAEKSQREYAFESSVKIDRIDETWKLKSELFYETDQELYIDDENILSKKEETGFEINLVYSLDPRWSLGFFSDVSSSSYLNTTFEATMGPAIEYNLFPWDKSDRKVFSLAYHLQYSYFNYDELTIFNKQEEFRAAESLRLALILRQPWGEIENTLVGSHYFHDFSKNRISLDTDVSILITKGLALFCELEADLIHDQLYLSAEGASTEEILLNQKKQATHFDVEIELGVKFTFGSIFNNVVNERFSN